MKRTPARPVLFSELSTALAEAGRISVARGSQYCVISRFSPKRGHVVYRVLPLEGFGLPAGWTFEEAVEPPAERPHVEPPEKTSTNGF